MFKRRVCAATSLLLLLMGCGHADTAGRGVTTVRYFVTGGHNLTSNGNYRPKIFYARDRWVRAVWLGPACGTEAQLPGEVTADFAKYAVNLVISQPRCGSADDSGNVYGVEIELTESVNGRRVVVSMKQ